ncbi:SUMF1/EgtB/PvdO family nonheme iron enzyme [Streptomyces sp. NPDC047002]|uniref:formylglycine-generating enzyme family protein n=1 Tax=Streptomyces sp. NPDC047002 TaxID=3155475 RepID=UPI0034559DFB
MGLPHTFVSRLDPADIRAAYGRLSGTDPAGLAEIAEDGDRPFADRWTAGSLLALAGDPRIDPESPAMAAISGGRAAIGLPEADVEGVTARWSHVGVRSEWIAKETPRHPVDMAPFRLARYPVTNLEYRGFLADTSAAWLPTSWQFGVYPAHLANHPVWTVPPEAADAYAAWLARRTGRPFRLPTEAEWEYAAGAGRAHPWGEAFAADAANTVEQGPLSTTPVGIYPAGRGPFGLSDMGGNVEEYVSDDYRPYPGGAFVADDLLTDAESYRVARGGSFTRYGDLTRCSRRHGWYRKPIYAMGFRLAEDV